MSSTPAPAARPPRDLHEDEEELALPPLDGARDDEAPIAIADDDDDALEEGGAAASDDGAPTEMDAGILLDVKDEETSEGSEPARDAVDIGSLTDTLTFLDDVERDDDAAGLGRDDDDDSPLDAQESDDDGAGTGEDPSAFVDERALPPLDEDEDARPSIDAALRRSAAFAPSRARWRVASGMGAQVPCWLVATSPAHVVAAGPTVILARDGGRVSKVAGPDIDAIALAVSEEAIFAIARKGALFASVDGGDSWATDGVPWPSSRGVEIAATPGRLWICEGGALWSVRWSRKSRPEAPALRGGRGVRAMIAAGSTLVLLSEKEADLKSRPRADAPPDPALTSDPGAAGDLVIERLRGDDEAPDAQPIPADVRAAIGDAPVMIAASPSGRSVALLASGSVHLSRDGGATFTRAKLSSVTAIAFAGDDDAARLVALTARDDRASGADRVLVEVLGDATTLIAEVPADGGGPAALAWDSAREVLWLASPAGLVAYERSTQH